MESFATPADVRAQGRSLSSAAERAAEQLLEYASALLRSRVATLDERIASGDLDPVLPRGVVVRMVTDALNHGDRVRREVIGETQFEYDIASLRQGMEPTEAELGDLRRRPPTRKRRGPVGTIHMRSTI